MECSDTERYMLDTAMAEGRHLEHIGDILFCQESKPADVRTLAVEMSEDAQLTDRERTVFLEWIDQGVRFDTAHWIRSIALHLDDIKSATDRKLIIGALFIDMYNRADDVMDNYRDRLSTDGDRVDVGQLHAVSIMFISQGRPATVSEFQSILLKMIDTNYFNKDATSLKSDYRRFLNIATQAISEYEQVRGGEVNYNFAEAKALRYQTLQPLSQLAITLSGLIDYSAPSREIIADEIISLAMVAQFIDDLNDYRKDFEQGNVNLVLGLMAEEVSFAKRHRHQADSDPNHYPPEISECKLTQEEFDVLVGFIDSGQAPENGIGFNPQRVLDKVTRELREEYQRYADKTCDKLIEAGKVPPAETLKLHNH